MRPIEKRCAQRDTHAFVTPGTVEALGEKMIGIIGDRRMTKMHRYLGESGGTPRLFPGLRVWRGGYSGPVRQRPKQSVSVSLASDARRFEGVSFSVGRDGDTEDDVAHRYHHPAQYWLGRREDITFVELDGWPGSPGRYDSIRIEYRNENGVGQETILVFDDVDHVQEIAWDVKGDELRQVYMDDEWCTLQSRHLEDPQHRHVRGCAHRRATLAENLSVLVRLADKAAERSGTA